MSDATWHDDWYDNGYLKKVRNSNRKEIIYTYDDEVLVYVDLVNFQ